MDEKTRKGIEEFYGTIDEGSAILIAGIASDKFHVSLSEAMEIYEEPFRRIWDNRSKPKTLNCHYCGLPATSFGFLDEPICPECGG